ncbi:MAG: hypothetical protein IJR88_02125 [Clostridia bacterium]|nr:hypothetical protein [Clostridia bacterium]
MRCSEANELFSKVTKKGHTSSVTADAATPSPTGEGKKRGDQPLIFWSVFGGFCSAFALFPFSLAFWKNLCYNEAATQPHIIDSKSKRFDKNVCSFAYAFGVFAVVLQQLELRFLCVASAAHFLFI